MKLSDTARVVLSRASQHPDRLAEAPKHLPAAARDAVVRSLLKHGLLAEAPCPREHLALASRQDEDGVQIALQITSAGLRAIGVEPEGSNDASNPSEAERDLPAAAHSESHAPSAPSAPHAGVERPEPPATGERRAAASSETPRPRSWPPGTRTAALAWMTPSRRSGRR